MTETSFLGVLCSSILKEFKGSSFEKDKLKVCSFEWCTTKTSPWIGFWNLSEIFQPYSPIIFLKKQATCCIMFNKRKPSPTVWPCFYWWSFIFHDFPLKISPKEIPWKFPTQLGLADGFGGFGDCNQLLGENGQRRCWRGVPAVFLSFCCRSRQKNARKICVYIYIYDICTYNSRQVTTVSLPFLYINDEDIWLYRFVVWVCVKVIKSSPWNNGGDFSCG